MNQRDGLSPPGWLNGQTIAIVSTVLTVGVGIGAMVFASTSSIRGEISGVRGEISGIRGEVDGLTTKLEKTRERLSAEIKDVRLELSAKIEGLDARLRNVEQDVAVIKDRLAVRGPVTRGASPFPHDEDDAGA